jgi:hypothetical protein
LRFLATTLGYLRRSAQMGLRRQQSLRRNALKRLFRDSISSGL